MTNDNLDDHLAKVIANQPGARSYSGRGMYGRECAAVVSDNMKFMANIIVELHDDYEDDVTAFEDAVFALFEDIHQDNMGLSTVYYWPSIPWRGEDEDDDDDVKAS
jgi:hypothetical protein